MRQFSGGSKKRRLMALANAVFEIENNGVLNVVSHKICIVRSCCASKLVRLYEYTIKDEVYNSRLYTSPEMKRLFLRSIAFNGDKGSNSVETHCNVSLQHRAQPQLFPLFWYAILNIKKLDTSWSLISKIRTQTGVCIPFMNGVRALICENLCNLWPKNCLTSRRRRGAKLLHFFRALYKF